VEFGKGVRAVVRKSDLQASRLVNFTLFNNRIVPYDFPMLRRNPYIDLLRGLSILIVVVHHVSIRIPLKDTGLNTIFPDWIFRGLNNGHAAVFIFFVISGYLITSNSIARWSRLGSINIRSFYSTRAARILPCLLILIATLSALHLAGVPNFVISEDTQSLAGAIFAALGLHLNWYEGQTGYLPASWDVLWSLSIEEVFYLAFPILCMAIRKELALSAFFLLFAILLPVFRYYGSGSEIWQEKAYLPAMAAIAAGVFTALIAHQFPKPRKEVQAGLQIFGLLGVFAVLCFSKWVRSYIGSSNLLLLTISTSCLLFCWRHIDHQVRWTKTLQSFGRLSYEIYLTHMFAVWPVVYAFRATGKNLGWGFVWYIPALFFSWALGWIVAKYISIPADKKVRNWLMRDPVPTPHLAIGSLY
jgi:peptidoglycan/LPS O-acetylase OafA/YrhL